jgi:RNA polymerase sigma-70 factor (ECF subfamily)
MNVAKGNIESQYARNRERSELVQRCLKGDDQAWASLVDEYRGLVYSICYLYCGSTQDADDLVQDTFLKIWINASGRSDQSDSMPLASRIPDTRPTPHEAAQTREVTSIVTRAVNRISPEMREVVTMRFVHGFDNQEIAHRLRIPEGTVKSRTNRGRAQLASLLSPMRHALGAA